jgi:type VI secretion system Hcp family effector
MALEAYILVDGFEGTSKKTGHPAKSSILHKVEYDLVTPTDEVHHTITGNRQHSSVAVELLIDASSYQYWQACIDKDKQDKGKRLKVKLGFFRTNQDNIGLWGAGETKEYYTIELADALVKSVSFRQGDKTQEGGGTRSEYLRVEFVFRQITWTYMNGNKASTDAWDAK